MNELDPSKIGSEGTRLPASQINTPSPASSDTASLGRSESQSAIGASPVQAQAEPSNAAVRSTSATSAPTPVPQTAPSPTPEGPPLPRAVSARVERMEAAPVSQPPRPFAKAVDLAKPLPMETAQPVKVTNAAWESELERSALSTGVDVNLMRKIAGKESSKL